MARMIVTEVNEKCLDLFLPRLASTASLDTNQSSQWSPSMRFDSPLCRCLSFSIGDNNQQGEHGKSVSETYPTLDSAKAHQAGGRLVAHGAIRGTCP